MHEETVTRRDGVWDPLDFPTIPFLCAPQFARSSAAPARLPYACHTIIAKSQEGPNYLISLEPTRGFEPRTC